MRKNFFLLAAALLALPVSATQIFVSGPSSASGSFDVVVTATNLFDGRDPNTDLILSYGFDIGIDDPSVIVFTGATPGPLFDALTTVPGTDVFAGTIGIDSTTSEPLTLATLHFDVIGTGPAQITISSDLGNPFQGLQYLNEPFAVSIDGVLPLDAVPEPAAMLLTGAGLIASAILLRRTRRSVYAADENTASKVKWWNVFMRLAN